MTERVSYTDDGPVWTNRSADGEKFVTVLWDQVRAFRYYRAKPASWPTFLVIVDVCQATGRRQIEVWPQWYKRAGLERRAFTRHLKALESVGLIQVERRRGSPSIITLSQLVPLREPKAKKR